MKEQSCDGCCYRNWHNGDISKCNYLSNNRGESGVGKNMPPYLTVNV